MARKNSSNGISPAGKTAILLVVFGIPFLFAGASWGLDWLFSAAPWAVVLVLVLVATAYTAHTSNLLYTYYEVSAPVTRFVPCLCEVTLIDRKYHTPCYILYLLAILCGAGAFLPYDIAKVLGETFVTNHTFWFGVAFAVVMIILEVIKGIGIAGCMKDVADDWYQQTHSDVGLIKRFVPMGFIPFVRVIALYSLNKPLDTMVGYMGVSASDAGEDEEFYEEEEEEE